MIEVQDLSYSYGTHEVLKNISFQLQKGELLSILGPNGVGKSTLFRCVMGLLDDYTGTVRVDGADMRKLSAAEAAKKIAYIPQKSNPAFHFSVMDMVLMGTTGSIDLFRSPGREEYERCKWAMDKIGITSLAERCFHRLSGGEQQLVMFARALAQKAPVLMMDEPTANLDYGNQLLVMQQARKLVQEGYSIIQTTHNPEQCYLYSDRILALKEGRIVKMGSAKEVFTEEVIGQLYGVKVDVISMYEDRVRVCVPEELLDQA